MAHESRRVPDEFRASRRCVRSRSSAGGPRSWSRNSSCCAPRWPSRRATCALLEDRLSRGAGARRPPQRPQRAPRGDAARGARPDRRAQGGDRPAGPAAERLRRVPRGVTRTARSTSSPAAASCAWPSRRRSRLAELQHGQEVMLNEAMNVVAARGFERAGEVVMLKEVLDGGDRALVDRPHRRGARRLPRRHPARAARCGPATRC